MIVTFAIWSWLGRVLPFTLALVAISMGSNNLLTCQDSGDDVRDALKNGKYPWYDSSKDELTPVDLPHYKEAASKDRNSVTKLAPKTSAITPPTKPRSVFSGLSILAWVVIGLVIALIVGLLVWAFFRLETQQQKKRDRLPSRSGRTREDRIKELPFDLRKFSGDFRELAYIAYQNGDYRTAMTYLFSHVLLVLDKSALIQLRKGKTNRQYLAELRAYRDLSSYYESVMVPFEDVFFGDHNLNKHTFDLCWDNLPSFQIQVKQTSQVAG